MWRARRGRTTKKKYLNNKKRKRGVKMEEESREVLRERGGEDTTRERDDTFLIEIHVYMINSYLFINKKSSTRANEKRKKTWEEEEEKRKELKVNMTEERKIQFVMDYQRCNEQSKVEKVTVRLMKKEKGRRREIR